MQSFNVVIEPTGTEQERKDTYKKTLRLVISKCIGEDKANESNNLSKSINRRTSREGLFNTSTEGRMY
ncbi:MAG: hypothetical protein ACM3TR_00130 [Caulobacteraceae bacterium]